MRETRLHGLIGSNPLGFLAAVGLQVALETDGRRSKLSWSEDVVPSAVVVTDHTTDLAEVAMNAITQLSDSRAFSSQLPGSDDLKFSRTDLQLYLKSVTTDETSARLVAGLVAEGSVDKSGKAKPTDLYFTAGQQRFLTMAHDILHGVCRADIENALDGPWRYESTLPTLMWDIADDANYALAARNPATEKKLTVPGAEALAIIGLSLFPVFVGTDRTLTTATRGSWKRSYFRWPLWGHPAGTGAIRSLIQQIPVFEPQRNDETGDKRKVKEALVSGWDILRIYESAIRRSEQGGYGSFSPPQIVWSRTTAT